MEKSDQAVRGVLTESCTWEGKKNLTGDVVVPAGATLRLAPGCEIHLLESSSWVYGQGFEAPSSENPCPHIYVLGTLLLEGSEGRPIRLLSQGRNGAVIWLIQQGKMRGDYLSMQGVFGSDCRGIAALGKSQLHLENSAIEGFKTALSCDDQSQVCLRGSYCGNSHRGVSVSAESHVDLEDCVVSICQEEGISLRPGARLRGWNLKIFNNQQWGFRGLEGSLAEFKGLEVENNKNGLGLGGGELHLENSRVEGNRESGLEISNGVHEGVLYQGKFRGSKLRVLDNQKWGVRAEEDSDVRLSDSVVERNHVGISMEGGDLSMSQTRVEKNVGQGLDLVNGRHHLSACTFEMNCVGLRGAYGAVINLEGNTFHNDKKNLDLDGSERLLSKGDRFLKAGKEDQVSFKEPAAPLGQKENYQPGMALLYQDRAKEEDLMEEVLGEILDVFSDYKQDVALGGGWAVQLLLKKHAQEGNHHSFVGGYHLVLTFDHRKIKPEEFERLAQKLREKEYFVFGDRSGLLVRKKVSVELVLSLPPAPLCTVMSHVVKNYRESLELSSHTTVPCIGLGGLLMLKAELMKFRYKSRDAHDVYLLCAHYGKGPEEVVAYLKNRWGDPRLRDSLSLLEKRFESPESCGARAVARFLGYGSAEEAAEIRQRASGGVRQVLEGLRA